MKKMVDLPLLAQKLWRTLGIYWKLEFGLLSTILKK
jgi:hypothetical protein